MVVSLRTDRPQTTPFDCAAHSRMDTVSHENWGQKIRLEVTPVTDTMTRRCWPAMSPSHRLQSRFTMGNVACLPLSWQVNYQLSSVSQHVIWQHDSRAPWVSECICVALFITALSSGSLWSIYHSQYSPAVSLHLYLSPSSYFLLEFKVAMPPLPWSFPWFSSTEGKWVLWNLACYLHVSCTFPLLHIWWWFLPVFCFSVL